MNQPIEEKWKRENCGHDVMKCLTEVEHLHKEIDILADYLLKHHHKDICGSAVDTAINIISGIPNLLEQEREKSSDAKFHFTNGVLEERKRMSDEIEKLYPPKFVNGYTTKDAKTFWEGKLQSYNEVLSIINK